MNRDIPQFHTSKQEVHCHYDDIFRCHSVAAHIIYIVINKINIILILMIDIHVTIRSITTKDKIIWMKFL